MRRTKYTTCVSSGMNNYNGTWKRVYTDDIGNYYVKENGVYVCINGTPSEEMMTED